VILHVGVFVFSFPFGRTGRYGPAKIIDIGRIKLGKAKSRLAPHKKVLDLR
jgi:hypothetical protein